MARLWYGWNHFAQGGVNKKGLFFDAANTHLPKRNKMKIFLTFFSLLLLPFASFSQTGFELDPNQSMIMYGKGPGQDATINPYAGRDCYAIVENLGKTEFSARIQKDGEIIHQIKLKGKETKKIKLLKDQELYLDPNASKKAKARVSYEAMDDEHGD